MINQHIESFHDWAEVLTGFGREIQRNIIATLLVIFLIWLGRLVAMRLVWRKTEHPHIRYRWGKTIGIIALIIMVFALARIWFKTGGGLITYLGFLTAGTAIALADVIASLAGWAFIVWRRPFSLGDRIQIGEKMGDVIDIGAFKFSLLETGNWVEADQSTGRVLHVPNSKVFKEVVSNYTQGFKYIWDEIPVLITFESDWRAAKKTLEAVLSDNALSFSAKMEREIKEASRSFLIFYRNLTPIVYTSVKDCGVCLTMRYLVEPRKRRITREAVWEAMLDEFAKNDAIELAYPTWRVFREGEPSFDKEGRGGYEK